LAHLVKRSQQMKIEGDPKEKRIKKPGVSRLPAILPLC